MSSKKTKGDQMKKDFIEKLLIVLQIAFYAIKIIKELA
jgi:hypothetical protein